MSEMALVALVQLTSLETMLALVAGVLIGLLVGILPGLGGTAGLALLLPLVFGMDPDAALALMIGLVAVTTTSDTFPSVLMGIPGTSGSQATVLDGFPMKKGEGTRALSIAFVSSLVGGILGAFVLSFAVYFAKPIILQVGFGEQFMLVILALSMVGILTGANLWKGLTACCLGLLLGALGSAPLSGVQRATFGSEYLPDPLPLVVVGLAMFATPEIVNLLRRQSSISETGKLSATGWARGLKDWVSNWWLSLRSSMIGSIIGALPGHGGSVVDWIAYGHAVQTTKNRESYGTGDPHGIVAPESANNAKEGGALVPTLLLGIPGSGSMAILLGGLVLIGIEPGKDMIDNNMDKVYLMIWSIAVANIIGAGICFALAPQIARITTIRYTLIAPFMIGIIFFAAFQATRNWGDLIALLLLSILAIYMKRFGWSRPALLIGFVLSERVEASVYQTVTLYGITFLERPIVLALLALTLASIGLAVFFKQASPEPVTAEGPHSHLRKGPQWIFILGVIALALYVFADGLQYNRLTGLFPMVASISTLVFLFPITVMMFTRSTPSEFFYDAERKMERQDGRSAEFYIGMLFIMLLFSGLVGFVLGIAAFIMVFLRRAAHLDWWKAILGGVGFVLFLGLLSNQLTLRYPAGLLQEFVNLPWPLQ